MLMFHHVERSLPHIEIVDKVSQEILAVVLGVLESGKRKIPKIIIL